MGDDSLPEENGTFWNVLRVVSENMRTAEDIWGSGHRREGSGQPPGQGFSRPS